jgi:ankyrin repeat protein
MSSKLWLLTYQQHWAQLRTALPTATDGEIKFRGNMGGTAILHLAMEKGAPFDVVELLVDNGAEINARNKSGWTPFWIAVKNKVSPEILQLLLERGADPDAAAKSGLTPLVMAIQQGDLPTVTMLLQFGAKHDLPFDNKSPVQIAREEKHTEIVNLLSNWPPPKSAKMKTRG